jgi:hypothetical protein
VSDDLQPHVRLTSWRIFNIIVLLGLGILKPVEIYRAQTAAATVADVVYGLIWECM